jgi:hypothetical protein
MKTQKLLFTILLMNIQVCSAQTKLINHKLHSGNRSDFSRALKHGFIGNSNFGMGPQRLVRNSRLDSVILLSPTKAVMITSESCHYEDYNGHDRGPNHLWSAGKDTVENHELFNAEKSVAEIRQTLKDEYFFVNHPQTVVFLGFDGNYPAQNESAPKKHKETRARNSPHDDDFSTNEEEIYRREPRKRSWFELIILSLLSSLFPVRF